MWLIGEPRLRDGSLDPWIKHHLTRPRTTQPGFAHHYEQKAAREFGIGCRVSSLIL